MTAERAARPDLEVGCVVACEMGLVVVLTDAGPVRATYGARMLGAVARDRSRAPEPGEWVSLRRWTDGPVTVELSLGRRPEPRLADVVHLRPRPTTQRNRD